MQLQSLSNDFEIARTKSPSRIVIHRHVRRSLSILVFLSARSPISTSAPCSPARITERAFIWRRFARPRMPPNHTSDGMAIAKRARTFDACTREFPPLTGTVLPHNTLDLCAITVKRRGFHATLAEILILGRAERGPGHRKAHRLPPRGKKGGGTREKVGSSRGKGGREALARFEDNTDKS